MIKIPINNAYLHKLFDFVLQRYALDGIQCPQFPKQRGIIGIDPRKDNEIGDGRTGLIIVIEQNVIQRDVITFQHNFIRFEILDNLRETDTEDFSVALDRETMFVAIQTYQDKEDQQCGDLRYTIQSHAYCQSQCGYHPDTGGCRQSADRPFGLDYRTRA